jgi:hypothetical protein
VHKKKIRSGGGICVLMILLVLSMSSNTFSFPYKRLDIRVKGTIAEVYDDNITFSEEEKKEDFITRLSLNLDGEYKGKTRSLGFSGNISQAIFAKHHNYNNMSGSLMVNFRNRFSKYHRIKLSNTFTRTLIPATFEDEFGRIIGRYKYYHNIFNLSYSRDISKKLNVVARYTNTFDKILREDSENSYLINNSGFIANYMHSAFTTFSLSYAFIKRRFESVEDTSTHTLTFIARRRWNISKRLYFDGTVGADFIREIEDNVDITGEHIGVSIIDKIDKDTTVRLSLIKRIRIISTVRGYFDSWQASGSFDGQLLKIKRLNSSLSVFYGWGSSTSYSSEVTNRLLGVNVAFAYAFSKNLSGSLSYTFSDSNSEGEGEKYTRNTISSGLTVRF